MGNVSLTKSVLKVTPRSVHVVCFGLSVSRREEHNGTDSNAVFLAVAGNWLTYRLTKKTQTSKLTKYPAD
jgi:hypothetical protein